MRLPKFPFYYIDWVIVLPVLIIMAISLATLYSINYEYFRSQFVFFLFSFFVFLFISQIINPTILKFYALPIYITSIILLVLLLVVGVEARGSVRWISFFGVSIQFSELLKPFLAISLASYLSNINSISLKNFIKTIILVFPISFLILVQPDLGNALIYGGTTVLALLIMGFPLRYFLAGVLTLISMLPVLWIFLKEYQQDRILTFLDPSRDPLGTSYNTIQAIISVGSGKILGKGFGEGTQSYLRFLPENHTDFIFAALSEQLGFIGSIMLITSFILILYRIYMLFRESEDNFPKYFSLIAFCLIFIHFFVNTAMNLGMLPIVGITLPLVSYGGSSLLSFFILLGLLFAVNKKNRRDSLEIH